MNSDWELLERYRAEGTEEAFGELVARHVHWIHSAARRQVGDDDLAKDVTQMVFSDLARKAHSLSRGTIVGAWLHRATRFASHRVLLSRRRQEERDRIHLQSKEAQSTSPINWAEVSTELDAALDGLPRRDREAIVLRYFECLDFRSIGADLGVTEDAAQKRVGRALEKLRIVLGRRGISSGVPALATALASNAVTPAPVSLAAAITATALSTLPIPGTGFLSTIALMNLKAVTVTLAALGVGTSMLLLVRSNRELRHSKENLEVQVVGLSRELADVRSETSGRHLQDSHGAESKAELLRLRGEIAKLRRNEGDTRRQPVDRSAEGGEEPTAVLADAGTDTPEAAATTSLWVFTQGLRERLSELLTEDPNVSPEVVVKRQDFFFGVMTNAFANRMMTGIGRVRTNQDGSFDVYYAFRDRETGESNNVKLLMRPSETGWRVDPGNPPEGL